MIARFKNFIQLNLPKDPIVGQKAVIDEEVSVDEVR